MHLEYKEITPYSDAEWFEVVKNAPKVSFEEQTPAERASGCHQSFGNKFSKLFFDVFTSREHPDPEAYKHTDGNLFHKQINDMERRYGPQWSTFLRDNAELIDQIERAYEGVTLFHDAIRHHAALFDKAKVKGDTTLAEPQAFAALGIEEMGMYAWRQLNPLLEHAAEKMREYGIPPEEYYDQNQASIPEFN